MISASRLLQRVSLRYHVRPLIEDEIKDYVNFRLKVAGLEKSVFSDSIYPLLYEYTGGVPRLINTLCDTALTCAYADNIKKVNALGVDGAIKELQWNKYSDNHKRHRNTSSDDSLYAPKNDKENTAESIEERSFTQGTYSAISSRALVEISNQLKRIADYLEKHEDE